MMNNRTIFIQILFLAALLIFFSACSGTNTSSEDASEVSMEGEISGSESESSGFKPYDIDSASLITLPSGLKYYMVLEGMGNQVKPRDKVLVHYHGMLTNGTVFDSSFERNQPIELSLDQVIQGWQEGLPLCKVGAKIVLIIPPELGYGQTNQNNIPAGSTLIFNIEVLGVNS